MEVKQDNESEEESFFRIYNKLKGEKQGIESLWQEIAEFCYPNMANFKRYVTNHNPDAQRQHRPIYDVTAEQSLDLFASSMMSLLCNPASKWLSFETEDEDLSKDYTIQIFLDELQDRALSVFNNPKNRFYDNIFLALKSIGSFGICPVLMEKDLDTICQFKAETPQTYIFEEDFAGNIKAHYLEYEYDYGTLLDMQNNKGWVIPSDLDKDNKHCVIRKIWLNPKYDPEKGGFDFAKYQSCYYLKSEKKKIHEDFFYETPVGVGRWDRINGTKWNDSPARVALSDVKMINTTQADTIAAIEKVLNPPLAISSESQVGTIDLSPNSVMVVQGDTRAAMTPIYTVGDVPSIFEWQQTVRESIRTSFFIDIFMTAQQADMTATEAQIRYQEKLRNIAPKITRLQTDLLGACIDRVTFILMADGHIEVPDRLRDNPNLKIRYSTPVSSAYRQQEAMGMMNYLNNLNMLAGIELQMTGRSTTVDNIDFDVIAREMAEMAGIKTKALLPEDEVEEIRDERDRQSQQQQQIDTAQQVSEIAKNVPNDQANT